jgi:hypothetical protein
MSSPPANTTATFPNCPPTSLRVLTEI